MQKILCAALTLTLLTPAFAQIGVKDLVKRKLEANNERNQQLEDAMSDKPHHQPAPTPAPANKNNKTDKADPTANNPIKEGWITRKSKDSKTDVRLFFAHPEKLDAKKPAPALVVLQEWWGVNDDIMDRTREFARHGYYAVAPDLYHGESTDDPKKAPELKAKMTNESAMIDMKTALDLLEEESNNKVVDPKRIASIGWCMGGEQSLLLSIADPRVKATVLFYGPLVTDPQQLRKLQGPLLAVFGSDDKKPSPADVEKFRAALKEAGKTDTLLLSYTGAGHAFASKAAEKMGAYKETQAKEAWTKTWSWLDTKLAKK